jgi:hypothetical protein
MSAPNPPLKFLVNKKVENTENGAPQAQARAAELTLPHGVINTPIFMPVGTQVFTYFLCTIF